MSLRMKKIVLLSVLGVVVLLANASDFVAWLDEVGVITWAQYVRSEYVTGTAITVVLALTFLLGVPRVISRCAGLIRRCPVCGHTLFRAGKYCGACGSRIAQ